MFTTGVNSNNILPFLKFSWEQIDNDLVLEPFLKLVEEYVVLFKENAEQVINELELILTLKNSKKSKNFTSLFK
jgi:hypothetical protein